MDNMNMETPVTTDPKEDLNQEAVNTNPGGVTDKKEEDFVFDRAHEIQLNKMMNQAADVVRVMEAEWNASKKEFKLTDSHMKELYKINEQLAVPMPEDLTDCEKDSWDYLNGLNNITEEDVLEIFGEDHPIIGIEHSVTIDRIKYVTSDYFHWTNALRDYTNLHNAYMQLIELKEDTEINELRIVMQHEQDPERKEAMQKSIDEYYANKYLDFLAEPIDPKTIERLVNGYKDEKKAAYWIERARNKLSQMKVSQMFILEMSQFEKRCLPEKYHKISNIFLLWFVHSLTFCNVSDKNDIIRKKLLFIVIGMDRYIRNQVTDKVKERMTKNITALLDQFIDLIDE